jgi:hypothetical protein
LAAALIASTFVKLRGALIVSLPDFGSLTDSACFAFRVPAAGEFASGLVTSGFFAAGRDAGLAAGLRATILRGATLAVARAAAAFEATDLAFAAFVLDAGVVRADATFPARNDFTSGFLTDPLADFGATARDFAAVFAFETAGLATGGLAAFFTGKALAGGRLAFTRVDAVRGAATRAFFGLVSVPRFAILLRAAVDFAVFDFAGAVFAWVILDFGGLAIFLTEDIRGALLFGSALETEQSSSGEGGDPAAAKKPIVRSRQNGSAQASDKDHPRMAARSQTRRRSPITKNLFPQSFYAQGGPIPDDLNLAVS